MPAGEAPPGGLSLSLPLSTRPSDRSGDAAVCCVALRDFTQSTQEYFLSVTFGRILDKQASRVAATRLLSACPIRREISQEKRERGCVFKSVAALENRASMQTLFKMYFHVPLTQSRK